MKKYCTYVWIILFLFTARANGQTYYKVESQYIPTVSIGGNTISVSPTNGSIPGGNTCGINASDGFWVGNPSPGGFLFSFTNPASDIKIKLMGLSDDERLKITINNVQYFIQTTDISPNSGSCNLPTTYNIINGELAGNWPSPQTENATLDINTGFPIFNVEISGYSTLMPPSLSGFVCEFYFVNDTCYHPFTAIANTPCVGGTLELSVDSLPGVTQYDWIKSSTAISSDRRPQIQNVQTTGAGTYFVVATKGLCQYSSSVNVTVNSSTPPLANTTTNNGPLCPGSNLLLSTGTISGVTYQWDGPDNFQSTQQNPGITNISSLAEGRYYVRTVSSITGCQSPPDSTDLVLFYPTAPPVAGGDKLVCRGTSLNLTASTIPSATYEWTGPGNFYSLQQNPVRSNMTYADSGDYYVVAKLNGCSSKPDTFHVSVRILTATPSATSNSPVCPGTDIVFSSSPIPNASYSWTGPNFSSTAQNPVLANAAISDAGNYIVTATVNGCVSEPDTVNVVIAILAATPDADNNGPVCPGKTLQLTANTIPNATYEWTGPNFNAMAQNPVIPNVTTANAGTYYVYAIINGCKSLPDTTVVVIETSTPTPNGQSNGPLCRGDELKLRANDIPNASYSWVGPGNFQSSMQNPFISKTGMTDTGNYIVIASVDGCNSFPDTVNVVFKPTPEIISASSNSPICEGDSLVLTAKGYISNNDEVRYTWTGPEGYLQSPSHDAVRNDIGAGSGGKYYISGYYNGCVSDTLSVDVQVKPKPALPEITAPETIRLGDTLKVSAKTITPGVSYRWECPDGADRADTVFIVPNVSKSLEGDYLFTTTLNGCSITAKTKIFVSDRETFILYPNPNNGDFTIKITLKKDRPIPIEIINPIGQVVYRDASETKNKLMIKKISLGGNLTNGIYILRLGLDGQTRDMRFVILR